MITILRFRDCTFRNKNVDHRGKQTSVYESDQTPLLCNSKMSSALNFCFYLLHSNPKEKDSKKKFIMRNHYYYYFDCQKLGSVGPVQQKINLSSPKKKITVEIQSTCIAKQTKPELTRTFT